MGALFELEMFVLSKTRYTVPVSDDASTFTTTLPSFNVPVSLYMPLLVIV